MQVDYGLVPDEELTGGECLFQCRRRLVGFGNETRQRRGMCGLLEDLGTGFAETVLFKHLAQAVLKRLAWARCGLATIHRGDRRVDVGLPGQQYPDGVAGRCAGTGQERRPVHDPHAHVADHHRERTVVLEQLERGCAVCSGDDLILAP